MMLGYWPEPGSGLTKDGWLHTGDVAVMDETGYFQIVDRLKDMVNVSGLRSTRPKWMRFCSSTLPLRWRQLLASQM